MSLQSKTIQFQVVFPLLTNKLDLVFDALMNQTQHSVSWMELYQHVYDMCTAIPKPFTDELFVGIQEWIRNRLKQQLKQLLEHEDLVTCYSRKWDRFEMITQILASICEYLDRTRLKQWKKRHNSVKIVSIDNLSLMIWEQEIFWTIHREHNDKFLFQIMQFIEQDRNQKATIAYNSLKKAIQSLDKLNVKQLEQHTLYQDYFEERLLQETTLYYQQESTGYISHLPTSDFVEIAEKRLSQESNRMHAYIPNCTHSLLQTACDKSYIEIHLERLNLEFRSLIQSEDYPLAKRIFLLASRLPNGLDGILDIVEEHAKLVGFELLDKMDKIKEPKHFVRILFNCHQKFSEICIKYFDGNLRFQQARDRAFQAIICKEADSSEILAKYCDLALKKPVKRESNVHVDLEEELDQAIVLFKFLMDKDVFQKFYSRMFAKRLIFASSVALEMERLMITKLNTACGFEYTSKLKRMINDVTLSQDLNKTMSLNLTVTVLTSGSWPISSTEFNELLPVDFEESLQSFTSFYHGKHSGRKLTWCHQFSKAQVRILFTEKPFELNNVSPGQVSMLLLFNNQEKVDLKSLLECASNSEEAQRLLKPLLDLQLLIQQGQFVKVNQCFTNKRIKIKLTTQQQQDERQIVTKSVQSDRNLFLQANIVRILKSRKTLNHNELLQELFQQCQSRFQPQVQMIKQCIEQLIDKQFLERSGNGYVYLA